MFKWAKDLLNRLRIGDGLETPPRYSYRSGWDLESREAEYVGLGSWSSHGSSGMTVTYTGTEATSGGASKAKKEDLRVNKKPVEVFKEIIAEIPEMNIDNIDAHIKLVERRQKLFKELGSNSSDEDEALIFLKSRKAGIKNKTNFRWSVTNLQKISDLLKKYHLAMVPFEQFNKTVPMEAVDELEAYLKEYQKVSDSKPVLKLIIDDFPVDSPEGKKQSQERKKDPILLASSPFGRYFYILGAWDKEVEIVDDLIYHGK